MFDHSQAKNQAFQEFPMNEYTNRERFAFIEGARWQAQQPLTDEQIEAGARCWYVSDGQIPSQWDELKSAWIPDFRRALEVALGVRVV